MPKTKKTREEKIKSQYRLANFSLQVREAETRKDLQEFSYLSSEYVISDLSKTALYTAIIVLLLSVAKKYLG
jgi:hypothetical protein